MTQLLSAEVLAFIGHRSAARTELASRREIRKYSIATDQRQRKFLDGDEAPPMFYLPLFWDVVELSELTPDGVSIDSLLPEFPLKRAMAGGLKIDYHRPIMPGDSLTATRTLTDIYQKNGSKGPLIFYQVVMEIVDESGRQVVTEKTTRILR
ncbi:MAG: hydroxyacyl-ACP dehydratase HTD2-like protein with hotdog domain [Paraglaciecola psychrophila]|jgi:hydroxyacyl-ACP dehydratase HTD2-like protein with hotdog domain